MPSVRGFVVGIVAVTGVPLTASVAQAHKLFADVKVGPSIQLLAYFEEDAPAEYAQVTVTDATGQTIFTGQTDERGLLQFPKPAPGAYTLRVQCIGHTAKVLLEVPAESGPEGAAAEPVPQLFTEKRVDSAARLALGVGILLGVSWFSWLMLRRRRRAI
ncbi:MAG: carboxypeptidase-like regulatory domain-containing protein [Gemmataceae bacterium]|nr:carboxypeptidase-like regulatory domain-containing protein [Gemmata sp.]MDW8197257.1 carboxypeptidase-like regulatory domain-containing protein [Gemmataceae bacterium]